MEESKTDRKIKWGLLQGRDRDPEHKREREGVGKPRKGTTWKEMEIESV